MEKTVRSRFAAIQIAFSSARGADDSAKRPQCLRMPKSEKDQLAREVLDRSLSFQMTLKQAAVCSRRNFAVSWT